MALSDAGSPRKTYVVDTSILVSAPDALQNLTTNNTVMVPFPVPCATTATSAAIQRPYATS